MSEKEKELTVVDKLRLMFKDFTNRPSDADIEAFKVTHGDLFVSALNDDEMFLFRALTRKEHRDMQVALAEEKLSPDALEEEVVKTCLLWLASEKSLIKAGTYSSVYEQIMSNSNFLNPQMLNALVFKL